MMYKKGQAAMEYLMTYGWAILVLVIVLAALYYFLPKTQEMCLFQQGFECNGLPQFYVTGSNNELKISVGLINKLPQSISNIKILCTNAGQGEITTKLFNQVSPFSTPKPIGAGASFKALDVSCVDSDGNGITSNEGSGFKGSLAIEYSLSTDVDKNVKHISIGSVSGRVGKK